MIYWCRKSNTILYWLSMYISGKNLQSLFSNNSLFFFFIISPTDGKISHFIRVLTSRNNTKIVPKLLFLQVTFRKIFQLSFTKFQFCRARDGQFCAISCDNNIITGQSTSFVSNLDFIVKIFFKLSDIKDFVVDRLCAIDDEFDSGFLCFDLIHSDFVRISNA